MKMNISFVRFGLILIFGLAAIFLAGPAAAEKPPWAGGGKAVKSKPETAGEQRGVGPGGERRGPGDSATPGREVHRYFTEQHRISIHEYYAGQYRKGHCPPGLAKKRNGCMPPGLAKKWAIGRPLPASVIFYDPPPSVLAILGPAPSRHRFVRVAQDILLIAVGTGMVIDAIDNLSWEFSR